MKLNVTTDVPSARCCECGESLDTASGDGTPSPGDFSLRIKCASLNIFDDNLNLRAPTEEEMLAAAADGDVQRLRRVILRVARQTSGAPSAIDPRLSEFDIDLLRDLSGDKVEGMAWGAAMGVAIGPLTQWGYLTRVIKNNAISYEVTDKARSLIASMRGSKGK